MMTIKELTQTISTQEEAQININLSDTFTVQGSDIIKALKFKYSFFRLFYCDTVQDFIEHFNFFISAHIDNYKRIYSAMTEEYNPLWNIDGTEETITGNKADKIYNTPSTATSHTAERTFDDGDLKDISTNYISNVTNSETWSDNSLTDDKLEGSYNTINHVKNIRSGNIGITKSQDLLESEILVRIKYNLLNMIILDYAEGSIL